MDTIKLISENVKEKQESESFRERRFSQWNENYSLYRDKVNLNRLTQRQAVNIPIMRETIQGWISKIDEPPELSFKARGRSNKHKSGEIFMDELWGYYYEKLKLDIVDNLDKKVVGLQGRSFKLCHIKNNEFHVDLIDPYDIEISPRVNPLDMNTAQYVIITHIFKPLREILANKKYSGRAKQDLKSYLDSKDGVITSAATNEAYQEKVQRLQNLGADNYDLYNANEVLVELNYSFKMKWSTKYNQFVRHLIIIAADQAVLFDQPLKEAIGIDYLPLVSWADDPDASDFWCDGKGDSVRTINKVTNMYISQDLESRTYRTFGMHFFNTLNGTFRPQAFDPKPFGMYGVPGNPSEIIQSMKIEPLGDTMEQIGFLKNMIQSSVAQTPTERGIASEGRTTLGEVQINLEQSTGRNMVTAKNYRRAWKEVGKIFYDLMSNNTSGKVTLFKMSEKGNMYSKDIYPSDWIMPEGYDIQVKMKSESQNYDQFALQKAQYVIASFQDNPIATKIAKRKQLELMDWTTDEVEQAMQAYEAQQINPNVQDAEKVEDGTQANGQMFNNQQVIQQTNS